MNFGPLPHLLKPSSLYQNAIHHWKNDLIEIRKSLEENPFQGIDLGGGLRKIRMSIKSKGKGKAGGARIITFNIIISSNDMIIALVYIYDKADVSSVKNETMRKIVRDMGLK